jgi:putative component of membrane protein insertase Oxa1/YidC/SpoIIIJ protein YidD
MQTRIPVKIPIANIINGATRGLAVTAISGYQKFISPHKGFSCAHRVLYGCESCSQYFKQVIAEEGILTAIANAKGRFQECREANEILKKRREKSKARRQYYASRLPITAAAMESGEPENPDLPEEPEDTGKPSKQKLGGSQWGRKQQRQANNSNNGGGNNNCDYLDCSDCGYALDVFPNNCGSDRDCENPFEGTNCPDLSCPDLSCPDLSCPDLGCGNADCLSGMDCSGLDCGGLDCGGVGDCGSCG